MVTGCSISCPSNSILDDFNCQCLPITTLIPPCDKKCVDGAFYHESLNVEKCECERIYCDIFCPFGEIIESFKCISCSQCPCIRDPNMNSTIISTIISTTMTPPPTTTTRATTQCSITCREGEILHSRECQCVPDPNFTSTTSTTTETPTYPTDSNFNETSTRNYCGLVCGHQNFKTDYKICSCVCKLKPTKCPAGQVWSQTDCHCACDIVDCGIGFIYDGNVCQCVKDHKPICPLGLYYNVAACKCEELPTCADGYVYDHDVCDCVCLKEQVCDNLYVFDRNLCKCVCPKVISCFWGTLNRRTCTCDFDLTESAHLFADELKTELEELVEL